MIKVNTTVVAVVAPPGAHRRWPPWPYAPNVRVVRPAEDVPPLDPGRPRPGGRPARPPTCSTPDPLALVVKPGRPLRRAGGPAIKVAVAETLARWRARSLDLPDYYLVVDPESLGPTQAPLISACSVRRRGREWWSRRRRRRSPITSASCGRGRGGRTWTGSWPMSTTSSPTRPRPSSSPEPAPGLVV